MELLRRDYLRGVGERLDNLRHAIVSLQIDPADGNALADLRAHLHKLAGTAGTYGFTQVTTVAREGERLCIEDLEAGGGVPRDHLERWGQVLEEVTEEFEATREAAAQESAGATSSPPEIDALVVDDDEEVRCQIVTLLEGEGMATRTAGSCESALRAVAERMPDVLVVDVALPDGPGYEVVEHVRQQLGGDAPAILIVSGRTDFLDKVEAIRSGADGYFEKPIDPELFLRRLQHLVERDRPEAAKVLAVEDDPDHAAFVRMVLESAGFQVRTCPDPRRFEADLTAFAPDLVIMDLNLGDMSGTDLVRYIRQEEQHATLPIVYLTGEAHMQARIDSVRAGGDDYLVKPVVPGMLLATVASRIERARFLKSLLDRDGLTRLCTHASFMDAAKTAVARKARQPALQLALVLLDLDHFKSINDRFGHQTGDRVLVSLAAILRRRLRRSDTIGRYGGEEFGLVLEDLDAAEATRLVRRLLDEFSAIDHVAIGGEHFRAKFSGGISLLEPGVTLAQWIRQADEALYAAKAAGRNCVRLAPASASSQSNSHG